MFPLIALIALGDFFHGAPEAAHYRSSKWHYRQRKMIFELIMHFIADTDTDKNDLELFFVADADTAVLCSFEGAA